MTIPGSCFTQWGVGGSLGLPPVDPALLSLEASLTGQEAPTPAFLSGG